MSAMPATSDMEWLRASIQRQYEDAIEARREHEEALRGSLSGETPWELIEDYAEKRAREVLVREKLERYGWLAP